MWKCLNVLQHCPPCEMRSRRIDRGVPFIDEYARRGELAQKLSSSLKKRQILERAAIECSAELTPPSNFPNRIHPHVFSLTTSDSGITHCVLRVNLSHPFDPPLGGKGPAGERGGGIGINPRRYSLIKHRPWKADGARLHPKGREQILSIADRWITACKSFVRKSVCRWIAFSPAELVNAFCSRWHRPEEEFPVMDVCVCVRIR